MAEQVTLADVARWAGVSLATASRALHGSAGRTVGPELRARVRAAAAELNYSPNANARAIVRGTTTTVGLVVHDIADPSAAAIASGVMAAAAERDLIVTIGSTLSDPLTEIRHVEALRRQRARAIILAGSRFNDPESRGTAGRGAARLLRRWRARRGDRPAQLLPLNTIVIDNAGGARRLARALVSLGYRRCRRAGRSRGDDDLRGTAGRFPAGAAGRGHRAARGERHRGAVHPGRRLRGDDRAARPGDRGRGWCSPSTT